MRGTPAGPSPHSTAVAPLVPYVARHRRITKRFALSALRFEQPCGVVRATSSRTPSQADVPQARPRCAMVTSPSGRIPRFCGGVVDTGWAHIRVRLIFGGDLQ